MDNDFASYMIQLRNKYNLSQEEMASKLNIATNSIKQWERKEAIPNNQTITKIAKVFDLDNKMLLELANTSKDKYQKPIGYRSFVLANTYLFFMVLSIVILVLLCFSPNKPFIWILIFAILSALFVFLFTTSRIHSKILHYQNNEGLYFKKDNNNIFVSFNDIEECKTKDSKGLHLLYSSAGYLIIKTKDETYEIGPMKQVESIASEIIAIKSKLTRKNNLPDYLD